MGRRYGEGIPRRYGCGEIVNGSVKRIGTACGRGQHGETGNIVVE